MREAYRDSGPNAGPGGPPLERVGGNAAGLPQINGRRWEMLAATSSDEEILATARMKGAKMLSTLVTVGLLVNS